jgi:hypothetical protein
VTLERDASKSGAKADFVASLFSGFDFFAFLPTFISSWSASSGPSTPLTTL